MTQNFTWFDSNIYAYVNQKSCKDFHYFSEENVETIRVQ